MGVIRAPGARRRIYYPPSLFRVIRCRHIDFIRTIISFIISYLRPANLAASSVRFGPEMPVSPCVEELVPWAVPGRRKENEITVRMKI